MSSSLLFREKHLQHSPEKKEYSDLRGTEENFPRDGSPHWKSTLLTGWLWRRESWWWSAGRPGNFWRALPGTWSSFQNPIIYPAQNHVCCYKMKKLPHPHRKRTKTVRCSETKLLLRPTMRYTWLPLNKSSCPKLISDHIPARHKGAARGFGQLPHVRNQWRWWSWTGLFVVLSCAVISDTREYEMFSRLWRKWRVQILSLNQLGKIEGYGWCLAWDWLWCNGKKKSSGDGKREGSWSEVMRRRKSVRARRQSMVFINLSFSTASGILR